MSAPVPAPAPAPDPVIEPVFRWLADNVHISDVIAALALVASLVALVYAARSANASRESVRLAREIRDRDDQPQLEWRLGPIHAGGCLLHVTMLSGPAMIRVDLLSYAASLFYLGYDEVPPRLAATNAYLDVDPSNVLVRGGTLAFVIPDLGSASSIEATIMLTCSDIHEDRDWYIVERLVWDPEEP